jgi:hypothetical protein
MDDLVLALNEVETESLETTSESKGLGGSERPGYGYESEARLMDERQVLESKKILFRGGFQAGAEYKRNYSLRNSGHSTMGCE